MKPQVISIQRRPCRSSPTNVLANHVKILSILCSMSLFDTHVRLKGFDVDVILVHDIVQMEGSRDS